MKTLSITLFITLFLFLSVIVNDTNAEGFTFSRNLTTGTRGNDVLAIQQFLIAGGFLKISTPTNYFGTATKDALAKWQISLGIYPATGTFGPLSRGKINALATQTSIGTSTTTNAVKTETNTIIENTKNGSPIRITIPKLNVDAKFQYNGLAPDGTMEIPNNVTDVGWFTGSQRPGEIGVAVVTGHVAQIRGGVMTKPGVFKKLNELRTGDKLYVTNDKGIIITFVVRESRNYDPSADATAVFTSNDNGAHLNLITCDGTWNATKQSYSQRLVVFADAIQ